MRKNIITLLIVVLLLFSLSGCEDLGIGEALALKEKDRLEVNVLEDDESLIEYQGNVYYLSPMPFLWGSRETLDVTGDYEYLGWVGGRFLYHSYVYGDTRENPTFLYSTRTETIHLREDYDYRSDSFLIEGTESIIRFSDDLLDTGRDYMELFNSGSIEIVISSVTHPALKAKLFVLKDGATWYGVSRDMKPFRLSDNFVNILADNKIIIV